MNLTLTVLTKKKIKYFHLKPTTFFLQWVVINNRVIGSFSSQKLPRIRREYLVRLL